MKDWGIHISAALLLCTPLAMADNIPSASNSPAPVASGSAGQGSSSEPAAAASTTATPTAPAASTSAPSTGSSSDKAKEALKQQASDVTTEKNLEQVFQATEKTYSLLKAGDASLYYTLDFSYYYNAAIDIALNDNSSQITRFRLEEDAQDTLTNQLSVDYGVWDNLTFNALLPFVAKYDTQNNLNTIGLGDVSFSTRWQPVPVQRGLMTTTLFGSFSTASGASPYRINLQNDLSTGKGYYSLSGGASFNKLLDPVVLFGSISGSIPLPVHGLDQARSGRVLTDVYPGDTISMSAGMAYSLNYDISVTGSYQMSYGFPTKFYMKDPTLGPVQVSSADQVSASLSFSVGMRTSPTRIVNVGFAYGLTQNTPNVDLNVSMPIDFGGLMKSH